MRIFHFLYKPYIPVVFDMRIFHFLYKPYIPVVNFAFTFSFCSIKTVMQLFDVNISPGSTKAKLTQFQHTIENNESLRHIFF